MCFTKRDVILEFWNSEITPDEWSSGRLNILPKKGDLKNVNNYRGIMLLETFYKIAANILHARLLPIAENIDQEPQCGFRPVRSCMDAIFALRLALKKRKEHDLESWVLFIDLVKAFDRVPRPMLWCVLKKFGVPPKSVCLLMSLHDPVHVHFTVAGIPKTFSNTIGVKQGDTLGPLLFTYYIAAIMLLWRKSTRTKPCIFRTSNDFQLAGRRPKTQGDLFIFRDSEYADDTAALFSDREDLELGTVELIQMFGRFGMQIHTGSEGKQSKSEAMFVPKHTHSYNDPESMTTPTNSQLTLEIRPSFR